MERETILSLLQKAKTHFDDKGISEAKLSAELLLAHALKLKRIDLFLKFDQPITDAELQHFRDCVRRRLKKEPVQYIVGEAEFYGFPFEVSPDVLIPRPETEHLIDSLIANVKSADAAIEYRILDIGTGSGAIAVTLAKKLPSATIVATDISEASLEVARHNAGKNEVSERITFVHHDILKDAAGLLGSGFDFIVSNPPYISQGELAELQPEILDFEPMHAATDGADGLTFYRRIAEIASALLAGSGSILVEMGYGQSKDIQRIFAEAGFAQQTVEQDYSRIDRVLIASRK
jgi:release factor glutamine methyltransferase